MKGLTLVPCLVLAQVSHAQAEDGAYMGAAIGAFGFEQANLADGISDNTYAYELFAGYRFGNHFALEGGMGRTGNIAADLTVAFVDVGPVALEADLAYDIYTVRAIGFLLLDDLSLFGAAGYFSAGAGGTITSAEFGNVGEFVGHERGATAILGIQHDFSLDWSGLSIRGQFQWFDFGDAIDASGLSVSMLFRF